MTGTPQSKVVREKHRFSLDRLHLKDKFSIANVIKTSFNTELFFTPSPGGVFSLPGQLRGIQHQFMNVIMLHKLPLSCCIFLGMFSH